MEARRSLLVSILGAVIVAQKSVTSLNSLFSQRRSFVFCQRSGYNVIKVSANAKPSSSFFVSSHRPLYAEIIIISWQGLKSALAN